jgi:mono/diheme cytochrome c family protein
MKTIKHKTIFFITVMAAAVILFSFVAQKDNSLQESIKRGESIYVSNCSSCHMQDGKGISGVFPPVANSDYFIADTKRAIRQIKNGAKGEMKVNGIIYTTEMPAQSLTENQIADVMNYMRNSWGGKGKMIKVNEVKAALK